MCWQMSRQLNQLNTEEKTFCTAIFKKTFGTFIFLQVPLSIGAVIWYINTGAEALWSVPLTIHVYICIVATRSTWKGFHERVTITLRQIIVCVSAALTTWSCIRTDRGQYAAHGALMFLQVVWSPIINLFIPESTPTAQLKAQASEV